MTDDLVARLPTDAAARRLPEFIKTLRINRAARRESVYASDNVYALLDALDTAEARLAEPRADAAMTNDLVEWLRLEGDDEAAEALQFQEASIRRLERRLAAAEARVRELEAHLAEAK